MTCDQSYTMVIITAIALYFIGFATGWLIARNQR
jgi:hypothetical protein